jgi:hypothetical protein
MASGNPQEMGADEVKAFLSHLATQMNVQLVTAREKSAITIYGKFQGFKLYPFKPAGYRAFV